MNDTKKIEKCEEAEKLHEEVKTEWTDKIFLDKLLEALNTVKDAGAKYVRCLDCKADKAELFNITDIQFTSSLLDPESKKVTKICIIFDDDATKKCETVERFVELLTSLNSKIEENNRNDISVSFAKKDPTTKQFKQYRYYYDEANDTVLLAVDVPQIKLIQAFCAANPGYGNVKNLDQVAEPVVKAEDVKKEDGEKKEEEKEVKAAAKEEEKKEEEEKEKQKKAPAAKKPAAKKSATKKPAAK